MKKLLVLAALLMASPAAHAGSISFQIEGHKVRVHAPRNCSSLSCIQISAPSLSDSSISGSSFGNFKGFLSISRLPDHVQVLFGLEHSFDSFSDEDMVVGKHNVYFFHL